MNQRDLIKMSPAEVDEFLHGTRVMTFCSMRLDGTIHAVAMWYGFLDGAVAFETKTKSQKVRNLRRDPRLTCLVESGESYDELRGVELVGRGEIIEDDGALEKVGISVFERYYGGYREELRPALEQMLRKRVVVKLHVDRVVSWDHSKLRTG